MSERRLTSRVPCALDVIDFSGREPSVCRATNISEDGVYMRSRAGVLLEGERLALAMCLPGQPDPIWVRGQVVEQVQAPLHDGAAVRFFAVGEADQRRLGEYVGGLRAAQVGVPA